MKGPDEVVAENKAISARNMIIQCINPNFDRSSAPENMADFDGFCTIFEAHTDTKGTKIDSVCTANGISKTGTKKDKLIRVYEYFTK